MILSDVGCTPYTKLKVALREHYEMNEVTRLNKLLNETTLRGNERPSDLLHRLKNLGRDHDFFLARYSFSVCARTNSEGITSEGVLIS